MLDRIKQLLGIKKGDESPTLKSNLAKFVEILKDRNLFETVLDEKLAEVMIAPLMPNWKPAPEGTKCGMCGSEKVERSFVLAGGPFSGSVRCNECQYVESVCSSIARSCIIVEPLIQTTAEADQKLLSQSGCIATSGPKENQEVPEQWVCSCCGIPSIEYNCRLCQEKAYDVSPIISSVFPLETTIAKLAAELAAERSRTDALVAALPKCDICEEPATKAYQRGRERYCDIHGQGVFGVPHTSVPDYPRAKPLRAIAKARKQ